MNPLSRSRLEEALNNYDPNITWSKHTLEVTLRQWDYSAVVKTVVGGNCRGFHVMQSASSNIYDCKTTAEMNPGIIEYHEEFTRILLSNGEDTLECDFDDEDELLSYITKVEIVSHEATK